MSRDLGRPTGTGTGHVDRAEAGPDVEVLGRVEGGPGDGKIVAVRQGRLVATSSHPELTGDTRVHALSVELVREAAAMRARDHASSAGAGADAGSEGRTS